MKTAVALCSAVLTVALVTATLPAAAATTPAAAPKRPAAPQTRAPKAAAVQAAVPTDLAVWLGKQAAGALAARGFGFVMSQLGLNSLFPDGSTAQFDALKRQLDGISLQLTDVQRTLDTLLSEFERGVLRDQLEQLQRDGKNVQDIYNEYFKPLLEAAEAWNDAKKEGDQDKIDETFAALIATRNFFYARYDSFPYSSLGHFIHLKLVPGQALRAQGLVLLSGRYVNATDSATIRDLYDNFAELEALAAWMRMERWIPSNPPPGGNTAPGNLANYENARREWLTDTRIEHVNLPPLIPADVVIDAGPNARTTNGARMWVPAASEARYRPGHAGPDSVPTALTTLNADPRSSYGDWTVPTRQNVTTLLNAYAPSEHVKNPNAFLAGLDENSKEWEAINGKLPWPYVWANSESTFTIRCSPHILVDGIQVRVPRHDAVTTNAPNAVWAGRPELPSFFLTPPNQLIPPHCNAFIESTFAGPTATGGFLATRPVTSGPMDYMAQGNGPTIRPQADLRLHDMTNFYLAGVDMHGSNMRGAILTGANLDGADLSGTTLAGVTSGGIVGEPKDLPTGWALINGYLVGPGANLVNADLHGADLTGADLSHVTAGGVDCTGCKLSVGWYWSGLPSGYFINPAVNLRGVDLSKAELRRANLSGNDFTGVNFTGADLGLANLTDVDATAATFVGADLGATDFTGANLTRANLTDSNASGANFFGATMSGATLTHTVLAGAASGRVVAFSPIAFPNGWQLVRGYLVGPGASLIGADLSGADLFNANLAGANLTHALLRDTRLTNATLSFATLIGAHIELASFGTNNEFKFFGITTGGLIGTPRELPRSGNFRITEGYLVGPNVNLAHATFSPNAQLGSALNQTNFTHATLTGVDLTVADMDHADLTGAMLTNTILRGTALRAARLTGVISGGIVGTPRLPPHWSLINGYLVGPGADLAGAHLHGADFTGVDLTGADLTGADLTDATWKHTTCPNGVVQDTPCNAL